MPVFLMRVPILHHPRMLRKCFFKANDAANPLSASPLSGVSPVRLSLLCRLNLTVAPRRNNLT